MTVNKSVSKTSIRDSQTGVTAEVEPKSTGENALHVISETPVGAPSSAPVFVSNYKVASTAIEFALSPAGTTIYSFTGKGRLESFAIRFEGVSTAVVLLIDGVSRFTYSNSVSDALGFNNKPANGPITLNNGGKTMHFFPRFPIYFSTSFEIKGIHPTSKKVKAYYVTYTDES